MQMEAWAPKILISERCSIRYQTSLQEFHQLQLLAEQGPFKEQMKELTLHKPANRKCREPHKASCQAINCHQKLVNL